METKQMPRNYVGITIFVCCSRLDIYEIIGFHAENNYCIFICVCYGVNGIIPFMDLRA